MSWQSHLVPMCLELCHLAMTHSDNSDNISLVENRNKQNGKECYKWETTYTPDLGAFPERIHTLTVSPLNIRSMKSMKKDALSLKTRAELSEPSGLPPYDSQAVLVVLTDWASTPYVTTPLAHVKQISVLGWPYATLSQTELCAG